MAKRGRAGLSHEQKAQLWARWKAGDSVSDIARSLEVAGPRGHHVLACSGGIVPVKHKRSSRALRLDEREEISRGIAAGDSLRRIAARLQRPVCTVSRELSRNGGRCAYRANEADASAWQRAGRPKRCRLAANAALRYVVAGKLGAKSVSYTHLTLPTSDL